ncbi:MAG: hypothetical protein GF398_11495 [Chitinivibrionales bacterium]|nr:hypothetical protein [Chitinivibrionales bacterium]
MLVLLLTTVLHYRCTLFDVKDEVECSFGLRLVIQNQKNDSARVNMHWRGCDTLTGDAWLSPMTATPTCGDTAFELEGNSECAVDVLFSWKEGYGVCGDCSGDSLLIQFTTNDAVVEEKKVSVAQCASLSGVGYMGTVPDTVIFN